MHVWPIGAAARPDDGHAGIAAGPVDESAAEAGSGCCCCCTAQDQRQDSELVISTGHQRSDAVAHLQTAATVPATVAQQSQSCSGTPVSLFLTF